MVKRKNKKDFFGISNFH